MATRQRINLIFNLLCVRRVGERKIMCFTHIHLSGMLKLLTSSYNLETILQYPTCDKSEYYKAGRICRQQLQLHSSVCSMECSNCAVQFAVFIKSDKSQVNRTNSIWIHSGLPAYYLHFLPLTLFNFHMCVCLINEYHYKLGCFQNNNVRYCDCEYFQPLRESASGILK